MREQVEVLEHHAHLLPVQVDIALGVGDLRPIPVSYTHLDVYKRQQ